VNRDPVPVVEVRLDALTCHALTEHSDPKLANDFFKLGVYANMIDAFRTNSWLQNYPDKSLIPKQAISQATIQALVLATYEFPPKPVSVESWDNEVLDLLGSFSVRANDFNVNGTQVDLSSVAAQVVQDLGVKTVAEAVLSADTKIAESANAKIGNYIRTLNFTKYAVGYSST
jgi:hypothetical protein